MVCIPDVMSSAVETDLEKLMRFDIPISIGTA
jgi:hypothetical protein